MMDMEFDSQSIITPPGSPILGYSRSRPRDETRFISAPSDATGPGRLFHCKGPVVCVDKTFSPDGYFRRNEVSFTIEMFKSTESDVISKEFNGNEIASRFPIVHRFFGFDFDLTEEEDVTSLISAVRKRVSLMELLVEKPEFNRSHLTNELVATDAAPAAGLLLRTEIATFSHFLLHNQAVFKKFPIKRILNGLILTLSSVKDWPSSLQHHCGSPVGNNCSSAEFHLFHVHLELRWTLLIFFKLSPEILTWILDDLIHLAFLKFKSSCGSNPKSAFNCYCVMEFWAMLRLLVDELLRDRNSFGDLVKARIRQIHLDGTDLFPVWLVLSLSQLSCYEPNGEWNSLLKLGIEGIELHQTLKQWLTTNMDASTGTLSHLHSLIRDFLPQFNSDLACVMTLWSYWILKLDKGYEARNLDHYTSSTKWLRLVTRICQSGPNMDVGLDNPLAEPFHSFLVVLMEIISQCSVKDWKKLTSGFCSRLTLKTVEGFGENGLTRMTTLILCMAFVGKTDVIDLCQKLNDLLNFGKHLYGPVKFRGRCAMVLLLLQKSMPVGSCSAPLMKTVDEIMGTIHRNPSERDMIMTYWDLIQNLSSVSPHSELEQSKLISTNLTPWLASCGRNYLVRTLRILHSLFDSWILNTNMVPTMEKSKIAKLVVERADTFLQQYIMTDMESIDVEPFADLAVDFTVFQKLNGNYAGANRLFQLFALSSKAATKVSEVYLDRLIGHTEFGEWDNSFVSEIQLAQSWMRLVLLGSEVPVKLTAKILNADGNPSEAISSTLDSSTLLRRFLDFVNSGECYWTKGQLAEIWNPITEAVLGTVSRGYDRDTVECVVNAAVLVIQRAHLSKIYVKNFPSSLLVHILDNFVPNFFSKPPWEKLPPVLVQTLRKFLHQIVIFVSSTDWLHDPFLKRKLTEGFRFALLGFITTGDLDNSNPGLLFMRHIESLPTVPEQLLSELTMSLQQLIKEEIFMKRFLLAYLGFLKQRMVLTSVWLFSLVLELMVEKDTEVASKCNGLLANCIVLALSSRSRGTVSPQAITNRLITSFETIMTKHFSFRSKRFFDLFNTLSNHGTKKPVILENSFFQNEVLPLLKNQIEISERKQGGVSNSVMRNQLSQLEANVTNATQLIKTPR